jgi:hypothetical protein
MRVGGVLGCMQVKHSEAYQFCCVSHACGVEVGYDLHASGLKATTARSYLGLLAVTQASIHGCWSCCRANCPKTVSKRPFDCRALAPDVICKMEAEDALGHPVRLQMIR